MSKKIIVKVKKNSVNSFKEFPYYDDLVKRSSDIEDDWKSMCSLFVGLDKDKLSLLFAIIYHHSLINGGTVNNIPYKGKTHKNGRGIIIHGKDVPDDLKKIIQVYMNDVIE